MGSPYGNKFTLTLTLQHTKINSKWIIDLNVMIKANQTFRKQEKIILTLD